MPLNFFLIFKDFIYLAYVFGGVEEDKDKSFLFHFKCFLMSFCTVKSCAFSYLWYLRNQILKNNAV